MQWGEEPPDHISDTGVTPPHHEVYTYREPDLSVGFTKCRCKEGDVSQIIDGRQKTIVNSPTEPHKPAHWGRFSGPSLGPFTMICNSHQARRDTIMLRLRNFLNEAEIGGSSAIKSRVEVNGNSGEF